MYVCQKYHCAQQEDGGRSVNWDEVHRSQRLPRFRGCVLSFLVFSQLVPNTQYKLVLGTSWPAPVSLDWLAVYDCWKWAGVEIDGIALLVGPVNTMDHHTDSNQQRRGGPDCLIVTQMNSIWQALDTAGHLLTAVCLLHKDIAADVLLMILIHPLTATILSSR